MAKLLQAIAKYGPKIELKPTVGLDDVSERVADRTSSNKSEVLMMLSEESNAIQYFIQYGMPVKLPGIGIFTPSMDRNGQMSINFRADAALKRNINETGAFRGVVLNSENIGVDNPHYKALWDAEHADYPLEIEVTQPVSYS